MDAIRKCFPCLGSRATSQFDTNNPEKQHNVIMKYYDDPALEFIETIRSAAKAGPDLEARLNSIISASSLKENIANHILNGITDIIKDGAKMGEAMKKAVADATDKAREFAKEHPYYTVLIGAGIIVAIGVLVMLAPWVLEVLGFAARGPRAGMLSLLDFHFFFLPVISHIVKTVLS